MLDKQDQSTPLFMMQGLSRHFRKKKKKKTRLNAIVESRNNHLIDVLDFKHIKCKEYLFQSFHAFFKKSCRSQIDRSAIRLAVQENLLKNKFGKLYPHPLPHQYRFGKLHI